jgi:hypothetical protein
VHEAQLAAYSVDYLDATQGNAALFSGRVQQRLPGNYESLYLRQRDDTALDAWGGEIIPSPVPTADSYSVGDLLYDGVVYAGVRMRLDLYRDEMVVLAPGDSWYGAVVDPSRFGHADLRGYRVIASSGRSIPDGYYLQLHDGLIEVLKKETYLFDTSSMEFGNRSIRFYIKKDGVYHRVARRRGSILNIFDDRRSEISRFIRDNRLDFRRRTERALEMVSQEYERLTDL